METPEFFHRGYYNTQFTPEKRLSDAKNCDHFAIDDLLDFPNDDGMVADGSTFDNTVTARTSTDSSTVVDTSCNSSFSGSTETHFLGGDIGCRSQLTDGQFSSELCVPYDDLAELEWLSNFVEESFSSNDLQLQKLQLVPGMKARTEEPEAYEYQPEPNQAAAPAMFRPEMSVPAKARSKRSRAAPCNWTSRLLMVSPSTTTTATPTTSAVMAAALSSSSESEVGLSIDRKTVIKMPSKKKEVYDQNASMSNGEGRKCLHCATDKTPQWRTGPMGPKTLCNACGVRYKSGRLVPEYRPAASPTFVLTKHSNSHRKVLELRRQKEMVRAQQHQHQFLHPNMMFDAPSNGDDYLIHQHIGPDYRQLI